MCKKLKYITFFLFEINETSVCIPLNSNYVEYLTIFKFERIFLFLEGDGCLVKLVTAKVIRQHVFSFTLSYSLLIIFEMKIKIW